MPLSELISRQDSVRLFEFESLRQELKISLSDVQRFLSLGWIGVLEELHGKGLDMDILMDMDKLMGLWQDLYPFLLHLQQWILKLEKFLAFWEKVLYLLLFFSCVSEFPNSLRPPCTTMPWTIWPALVVLWGVCWMFYAPDDLDWEADAFEVENIDNQFPGEYLLSPRPNEVLIFFQTSIIFCLNLTTKRFNWARVILTRYISNKHRHNLHLYPMSSFMHQHPWALYRLRH